MSEMELKSKVDSEFLPYISKPARFLGNEFHAIYKNLDAIQLRVALCFADIYDAGIRDAGFEVLYHILNDRPENWAERCFAPNPEAESVMRSSGIPLFTLESRTPLKNFHLIGCYVQDILSCTNILNMLALGEIALRSAERTTSSPLVIGVGPGLINPEPMADFFDAVIIGDAEAAFLEIAGILQSEIAAEKRAQLRRLSQIPGVYVPAFYSPRHNDFQEFQGIDKCEDAAPDRIVAPQKSGGRPKTVAFKPLVPMSDFPVAPHSFEDFGKPLTLDGQASPKFSTPNRFQAQFPGIGQVQLHAEQQKHFRKLAHATADFPLALTLPGNAAYWAIVKEHLLIDAPRISYALPYGEWMFRKPVSEEIAAAFKNQPFVLAPHAASPRLRSFSNVNLRDIDLLNGLKALLANGWKQVQLSFTIGLPTEKDDDLTAIGKLVQKCLDVAQPFAEVEFVVFVQIFSARAHTPFQWEQPDSRVVLKQKLSQLAEIFAEIPVRYVFQRPEIAHLITTLSRGDRKLAKVIENAWAHGARFDGSPETTNPEAWAQAFQEAQIGQESYLASISITVPLPWDHINPGSSKALLLEEKLRAYQGQIHPQNKDFVSLGYSGMKRDEFEKFCQLGALPLRNTANSSSSQIAASPAEEPMRYGRRERKCHTPTPAIKRKIRIRYSKTGMMRFLSHLEIVRIFDRCARMAKIPLVYSQGLRKNPKISYGMPLPAGISSTAEYLDMEVEIGREVDIQELFNRHFPEGIRILQFKSIYAKASALAAIINRKVYEVLTHNIEVPGEWISDWLRQSEVVVERHTKDGVKAVDIRPFVQEISTKKKTLDVTIKIDEGRSAKITEMLESLFAPHDIDYRKFTVQRTGQYIATDDVLLTPFDVV